MPEIHRDTNIKNTRWRLTETGMMRDAFGQREREKLLLQILLQYAQVQETQTVRREKNLKKALEKEENSFEFEHIETENSQK